MDSRQRDALAESARQAFKIRFSAGIHMGDSTYPVADAHVIYERAEQAMADFFVLLWSVCEDDGDRHPLND